MKSNLTIEFDSVQEMAEFIAGLNPVITIVPPTVKVTEPVHVFPIANYTSEPETITTGGEVPYFNIKEARKPETIIIPESIFHDDNLTPAENKLMQNILEPTQYEKKQHKSASASLQQKKCVTCQKEFTPHHNRVIFCPDCKSKQQEEKELKKVKYHKIRPG